MKKNAKPMEYPSIRIYEEVVRRIFLNNLSLIFIALLLGQISSANAGFRPVFLVSAPDDTLSDQVTILEQQGARVSQRIPPQILIADLPDTLNPGSIPNIKMYFTSAISISMLEPMGPMAVAAGLQWNRRFVSEAQGTGPNTFGAMRVLVAQRSFGSLQGLTVQIDGNRLHAQWNPLEGALYYELEASLDSSFTNRFLRTRTNFNQLDIPLPAGSGSRTVHVRVRPVDHAEGEHKPEDDVFGPWSGNASVALSPLTEDNSLTAPSLSSPLDGFQTEGYTLPLEYQSAGNELVRIQISRTGSFADPMIDEVAHGGEYLVPSQTLHIGDSFYWRVRRWGSHQSPWSEKRSLRIGAPHNTQSDTFVAPDLK